MCLYIYSVCVCVCVRVCVCVSHSSFKIVMYLAFGKINLYNLV